MKKKDMYVSPQIEVIKIENEGVIASSANGFGAGGDAFGGAASTSYSRNSGSASTDDLEDMINNIFTFQE